MKEVVDDFKLSQQLHQFQLTLEKSITATADRNKIGQVLINLLANAIKYGPDNRRIDIRLLTSGSEALIRLKDYGIGIEEKDQGKIFERFYRAEGQSEFHYSGFGIGLYLASCIGQYRGGKISIDSA